MSLSRFRTLALGSGIGFLLLSSSARGQNLLQNPGFTTDLRFWSRIDQTSWNSSGATSAGSAEVDLTLSTVDFEVLTQCVAVTGGKPYDFGGRMRVPSGQGVVGAGSIRVQWYATPACTGAGLGGAARANFSQFPLDVWQAAKSERNLAPANALTATFTVSISALSSGRLKAFFDDFFLQESAAQARLTIPASASVSGANNTNFQTDLWLLNHSQAQTLNVTARYRCFSGITCASPVERSVTLGPRQAVLQNDVVRTLFDAAGTAGAIELSYDPALGDLAATSRTYTPSLPAPTYGTGVPALREADAQLSAFFLGLASDGGNRSSGFRSNAGVYNPSDGPVEVTLRLYDGNSTLLGSVTRTWTAKEAFQYNDVFIAVGAGAAVTRNAFMEVSATAPVFPFVTVIDNQSGDSMWVSSTQH